MFRWQRPHVVFRLRALAVEAGSDGARMWWLPWQSAHTGMSGDAPTFRLPWTT